MAAALPGHWVGARPYQFAGRAARFLGRRAAPAPKMFAENDFDFAFRAIDVVQNKLSDSLSVTVVPAGAMQHVQPATLAFDFDPLDAFRIILVLHPQVQAAELDDSLHIEQG